MPAVLLRFKANDLEKLRSYPNFSLWIAVHLAKIYFFLVVLTGRKKTLYLVGTVLSVSFLFTFHMANFYKSTVETESLLKNPIEPT